MIYVPLPSLSEHNPEKCMQILKTFYKKYFIRLAGLARGGQGAVVGFPEHMLQVAFIEAVFVPVYKLVFVSMQSGIRKKYKVQCRNTIMVNKSNTSG